jgi:radical SAM protein (TIGR01212 family)
VSGRPTQRELNPFKYSDTNKRYHTYDYYLRRTFGGKCAKIPLDGGFTCPNIDGRCGYGGCIYCSDRGSGDFAASAALPIEEQFEITREKLGSKWSTDRCIPYFQAHTNTYAPLEILKEKYEAALSQKGVVGLNIATRADCLQSDVVEYLAEIAERTVLTVELGLQSAHDGTARLINRGHTFEEFLAGYERLKNASDRINICVHIILGLPGEDEEMMLETVRRVAKLRPHQVKIHLLHVIKGTAMARMYERGEYTPLEKDEYVDLVCKSLELLPPDTVIGRLTGDGMAEDLLAPLWSMKKVSVINDIDKRLFALDTYQGAKFEEK